MKTIQFSLWSCEVVKKSYPNGRIAITLIAAENDEKNDVCKGEPIATASVNLVNEEIEEGYVAIKDYSENEGMLKALVNSGIVGEPVRYVGSGFVDIPICKCLI